MMCGARVCVGGGGEACSHGDDMGCAQPVAPAAHTATYRRRVPMLMLLRVESTVCRDVAGPQLNCLGPLNDS